MDTAYIAHLIQSGQGKTLEVVFWKCSAKKVLKNFRRKILVLESLFEVTFQVFRSETFLKETPTQVFSCEYCEVFENNFFIFISGVCFLNLQRRFCEKENESGQHLIESIILYKYFKIQKQHSISVLKKKFSENMQQIYRGTPMPKREIALRHVCSHVNLLHIFRKYFPKNTFEELLLKILFHCKC